MEKKSGGFGAFWIVLLLLALLGSCTDSNYEETLERGREKYYTGQEMTKEEYNAVKGFNEWKFKQGEHTYSEWDN